MAVAGFCVLHTLLRMNANEKTTVTSTWMLILSVMVGGALGESPLVLLAGQQGVPEGELPPILWANSRRPALGPRQRDLHQPTLMALLGSDFQPSWMSTSPQQAYVEEGKSNAELPTGLNEQGRQLLSSLASCRVHFSWRDLGPDFWPRWLRSGQCETNKTCSFPSGMTCLPAPPKHLTVLKWHCRLRKNSKRKKIENNVWGLGKKSEERGRRGRRSKYRCMWVKVPYPVGEKCICSC